MTITPDTKDWTWVLARPLFLRPNEPGISPGPGWLQPEVGRPCAGSTLIRLCAAMTR